MYLLLLYTILAILYCKNKLESSEFLDMADFDGVHVCFLECMLSFNLLVVTSGYATRQMAWLMLVGVVQIQMDCGHGS